MTRHKKILLEQTLREVQYGADIKRDGHMRSKCMRLRLITNTSFQVATISRDIVIQNVSAIQQLCYLITLWLYLFVISLFTPNFYYLNQAEWVKLIFIIYHSRLKKKYFQRIWMKLSLKKVRYHPFSSCPQSFPVSGSFQMT